MTQMTLTHCAADPIIQARLTVVEDASFTSLDTPLYATLVFATVRVHIRRGHFHSAAGTDISPRTTRHTTEEILTALQTVQKDWEVVKYIEETYKGDVE